MQYNLGYKGSHNVPTTFFFLKFSRRSSQGALRRKKKKLNVRRSFFLFSCLYFITLYSSIFSGLENFNSPNIFYDIRKRRKKKQHNLFNLLWAKGWLSTKKKEAKRCIKNRNLNKEKIETGY